MIPERADFSRSRLRQLASDSDSLGLNLSASHQKKSIPPNVVVQKTTKTRKVERTPKMRNVGFAKSQANERMFRSHLRPDRAGLELGLANGTGRFSWRKCRKLSPESAVSYCPRRADSASGLRKWTPRAFEPLTS